MPLIRTILVPIDGSKNSIRGLVEAIHIARLFRAKVTVLHVIPGIPSIPITDTMSEYRQNMKKQAREFFLEARKTALKYKTSLTEKVIFGIPQEEIADYANHKKYDLIVLGARGLSSIKQIFLGSVSNATIHKSKVPVLIVK
ncbi:MAG: universal stress protein [Thaumarchaeota archaeon]|nr:universal stress protein [Nitrososphaerota archaeon]